MTEGEVLILQKIDAVHSRVDDVHSQNAEMKTAIAALETKVHDLTGNGQPGRVTKLEEKVEEHEKNQNKVLGALGVIIFLLVSCGLAEYVFHKLLKP